MGKHAIFQNQSAFGKICTTSEQDFWTLAKFNRAFNNLSPKLSFVVSFVQSNYQYCSDLRGYLWKKNSLKVLLCVIFCNCVILTMSTCTWKVISSLCRHTRSSRATQHHLFIVIIIISVIFIGIIIIIMIIIILIIIINTRSSHATQHHLFSSSSSP